MIDIEMTVFVIAMIISAAYLCYFCYVTLGIERWRNAPYRYEQMKNRRRATE